MNKILNFLKRYYKCIYDFTLFKSYLKEPRYFGIIFLMPLFLVFTIQTFLGSTEIPKDVLNQVDGYYNHILDISKGDVLSNGSDSQKISASFSEGTINLEQDQLYDETFSYEGKNLRLILDTHNSKDMAYKRDPNDYTDVERSKIGFDSAYMVAYVNDDFIIINIDEIIYSYDLTEFEENRGSILGMYNFIKDEYIPYFMYFVFSIFVTLILYLMYYFVTYFITKSFVKRKPINVSKSRIKKVVYYAVQPGMYTYFLLNLINEYSPINIAFVIPLFSMLVMYYVASRTINQMEAFIKKEKRKARKKSEKTINN